MAATNNSTDCYNFINSKSQLVIDLSISGLACLFGAGSCLTAIVLILVAKGHKVFIYRLLLYMAVDGLLGCLITLVYDFESSYIAQSYYEMVKAIYFILSYLILVYSFLLCWLGLYLFSLAVFRVQLKKTKHEAIGLVTVLVTPLTFCFAFLWKINFCTVWNRIKMTLVLGIPIFLVMLLSCLFIGAVLIALCLNAIKRVENALQQQHRKAVRETIPLVVFMIAHIVTLVMVMVISTSGFYIPEGETIQFLLLLTFWSWPIALVSLPILLLFQPHIRRKIKFRQSQRLINVNAASGYGTTVHQSHPSSYRHFNSPHESSHLTCSH